MKRPSVLHELRSLNTRGDRNRSCSGEPPLADLTKKSCGPVRMPANAIRLPSGDHCASKLAEGPYVNRVAPPRSRSAIQMSDSSGEAERTAVARRPPGATLISVYRPEGMATAPISLPDRSNHTSFVFTKGSLR